MRKQPTTATVKRLFALSGNLCAFKNCTENLIDASGNVIGEICHIEAAKKGGERYNSNQTDDERRHFSNLILLCPKHHIVTNDVNKYTVEILKEIKSSHEGKYKDNQFSVSEAAVKAALLKLGSITINNVASIGSNSVGQGTQHIQQTFNISGLSVEQELTAIDTIFEYVLGLISSTNHPNSDRALLEVKKKIALNFSDERDQSEVEIYFKNAYLKISLIESRFSELSSEQQKDIHTHILSCYKNLVRKKLQNIEVLHQLFDEFTPNNRKKDPQYTTLAKAFVLMFFEDCTIFEKVKPLATSRGKSVSSNKTRRPKA